MMTRVYERLVLDCPYLSARDYLHRTLERLALRDTPELVRLRLCMGLGELGKDVLVTYDRGQDPLYFDEPWKVHWTPEGGGPYPDFDGFLTVRADEVYHKSVLELRGEYLPPLGALGQVFDRAVGSRIASSTARELLARIGARFEQRFASEESAKQTAS